jgi:hypothetical protein
MKRAHCPHCGAMLREKRCGVLMSPLKAKLIDLVKAAGSDGIAADALLERLPIKGEKDEKRQRTLNVHVNQLNDALEETGWRIINRLNLRFLVRKALPRK